MLYMCRSYGTHFYFNFFLFNGLKSVVTKFIVPAELCVEPSARYIL